MPSQSNHSLFSPQSKPELRFSQVIRLPYKCICPSRQPDKSQSKCVRRIRIRVTDEFVFNNALDEAKVLFAQNRVQIIHFPAHTAYFSYQLDLASFKNLKNLKQCIQRHREVNKQVAFASKLYHANPKVMTYINYRTSFSRIGFATMMRNCISRIEFYSQIVFFNESNFDFFIQNYQEEELQANRCDHQFVFLNYE